MTQSSVGPPPTPACTPLAAGMALTATVQATGVVVEMVGLQPGEMPEFQYAPAGQPREGFTITPSQPVGTDGRTMDQTWVRTHAEGSVPELWDIRVIHVRGVACTQVVLPPA